MDGVLTSITNALNDLEAWLAPINPGSDILALLAFALYVLLILGGGLVAVLSGNLVRALVGLIVTFLGVAGMYLLMASPFMAFMQLLIYVGAICVLIFFAIMMTKNTATGEEMNCPGFKKIFYAAAAGAAPILLLGHILVRHADNLALKAAPVDTPLAELGQGLLENYVLPFEIISIVLLIAMAGGVLLVWQKQRGKIK